MAQKRMFDKTITNSDEFLDLPDSTQVLYFHLSMNADDDGFVNNWKSILRMTGTKEDDLKLLVAKAFIIPFDSGVIVIRHWRINNYLRNDRHVETNYKEELAMLTTQKNGEYSLIDSVGIPLVYPDKNSIDKNNKEEIYKEEKYDIIQTYKANLTPNDYEMLNEVIDKYTEEELKNAIEISKNNNAKSIKYLIQVLKNPIKKTRRIHPKWLDEEIKGTELIITDEERREIDEIIKGT